VKRSAIVVATLFAIALAGTAAPAVAGGNGGVAGDITVFAASSLTDAFTRMGEQFERQHPRASLRFNFLSSSELATQIQQGAPADVFASADGANLQKVVDSGDVTAKPVVFARNRLEIAVEPGNPKHIEGVADLAESDLVVVLCADAVPCGTYAAKAFVKAGVTVDPDSKAESAKAVVTTVSTGEADAGIVYVTDVKAAQDSVEGVRIPSSQNVIAAYPIAVVAESSNPTGAKAWVQYVSSKKGQRTLRSFGFLAP
jgi:molybdate transport system substrate-binding protein